MTSQKKNVPLSSQKRVRRLSQEELANRKTTKNNDTAFRLKKESILKTVEDTRILDSLKYAQELARNSLTNDEAHLLAFFLVQNKQSFSTIQVISSYAAISGGSFPEELRGYKLGTQRTVRQLLNKLVSKKLLTVAGKRGKETFQISDRLWLRTGKKEGPLVKVPYVSTKSTSILEDRLLKNNEFLSDLKEGLEKTPEARHERFKQEVKDELVKANNDYLMLLTQLNSITSNLTNMLRFNNMKLQQLNTPESVNAGIPYDSDPSLRRSTLSLI